MIIVFYILAILLDLILKKDEDCVGLKDK